MMAICLKPQSAEASHMAGADLTYEPVPGNPMAYLVRLKLYRDCEGIALGTTASICYSSATCNYDNTATANEVAVNILAANTCVTTAPTCGSIGDVEEHIYEVIITLPQACTDWRFSWSECCRNAAITNLTNGGGQSMYISALLNNVAAPANTSPSFSTLAYTRFCVGKQFFYDQGATEPDGDSLAFSLVAAQGNTGSCPPSPNNLTYVQPYTPTQPVGASVPMTIDPNNGLVFFVPNTVQVGVFCVRVQEFRAGVLIGEVKRDIQINVVGSCNLILPSFVDSVLSTSPIIASCNDYSIIIPFDTNFQCASAIPSDFRTVGPLGIPNPCVSVTPINCVGGQTDSLMLTFLNPLSIGSTYLWVKKGLDGNTLLSECGSEMMEATDTLEIIVTDSSSFSRTQDTVGCIFNSVTVNLTDSIYCFSIASDGSDFTMVDANSTVLPIASAWGYCTPGGLKTREVLINMVGGQSGVNPIYLILNSGSDTNSVANSCGRFLAAGDTIAEFYVDNYIPVNLGTDQNVCDDVPAPVLNSGYASTSSQPLTFQWFLNNNAIPSATDSIYTATQSGNYTVTISASPTCNGADTVQVTINKAPADSLGPDEHVCLGVPLTLMNAYNTGSAYQWYLNGVAIAGATQQTYQPTANGTYSVLITVGGGVCFASYDKIADDLLPSPIVAVPDTAICRDGMATLDAGNPGYTFSWSTGATTQSITTNTEGTYHVTVSQAGCVTVDSSVVMVQDYPAAPDVACQPGTTGQYKFIYVWTGNSMYTYEVSEDKGMTWAPANDPLANNGSHGTNNTVPYFLVRALGPAGTICREGAVSDPTACEVVVPNIFTPNNDNINEFFKIENVEQYPNNTMQIFNRWGKEVFSSSPYDNGSNRFDGKDLPDGVYFYILNLNDGKDPKTGNVTISR